MIKNERKRERDKEKEGERKRVGERETEGERKRLRGKRERELEREREGERIRKRKRKSERDRKSDRKLQSIPCADNTSSVFRDDALIILPFLAFPLFFFNFQTRLVFPLPFFLSFHQTLDS